MVAAIAGRTPLLNHGPNDETRHQIPKRISDYSLVKRVSALRFVRLVEFLGKKPPSYWYRTDDEDICRFSCLDRVIVNFVSCIMERRERSSTFQLIIYVILYARIRAYSWRNLWIINRSKKMLLNERNINSLHETIHINVFEEMKNFTLHTCIMIWYIINIKTVHVNIQIHDT